MARLSTLVSLFKKFLQILYPPNDGYNRFNVNFAVFLLLNGSSRSFKCFYKLQLLDVFYKSLSYVITF